MKRIQKLNKLYEMCKNVPQCEDCCLYGRCPKIFATAPDEQINEAYEIAFGSTEECNADAVEHPAHYTSGGIECIKAIEASMSAEEYRGYCKGNCLKYIWRYRQKNGIEDLKKAKVYLNWLIESMEKEGHT